MDTEDSGLVSQPWRDLAATTRPQETQNGSGGGIYWFYCPKEKAEKSRTYPVQGLQDQWNEGISEGPRRKHPGQQWPDSRACPRQVSRLLCSLKHCLHVCDHVTTQVLGPRPSSDSWHSLSVDPVASCVAAAARQAGEAKAQPSVTEHPLLP